MKQLSELMNLEGRVALVTGAAGHLGSSITHALAELGASIAVLDLSKDACDDAANQITEVYNVAALPMTVDLADEAQVRSVPAAVIGRFGKLDILFNCAALVGTSELEGWAVDFAHQTAETWRKALEVNLTSNFILVQACADALSASGRGSVINIGSTYGLVGPDMRLYDDTELGNPAAYAASKGGVLQLTRWLATTLAPHVRVNAITMGGVWRNQPESFQARYVERTPMKRMATEEDIKGAAAYLSSDLSAYVTGHNLVVDGGWTAW